MTDRMKQMKTENIRSVFSSVLSEGEASRAAVSDSVELSLVSVGKIADLLISAGVFTEEKHSSPGAGRRAGSLRLNPEKYSVVFDLTNGRKISYCRIDGSTIKTVSDDRDDLTDIFADAAMTVLQVYGHENCFGIGLISDSEKERGQALSLLRDFFPDYEVCSASSVTASFFSHICRDGSVGKSLYISINGKSIYASVSVDGNIISVCDCGLLLHENGKTLNGILSERSLSDCIGLIAADIVNSVRLLIPERVYISLNNCENKIEVKNGLITVIDSFLSVSSDTNPAIIFTEDRDNASHGITDMLREKWFASLADKKQGE